MRSVVKSLCLVFCLSLFVSPLFGADEKKVAAKSEKDAKPSKASDKSDAETIEPVRSITIKGKTEEKTTDSSVTLSEVPVLEIPRSVETLDNDFIQTRNLTRIPDIVKSLSGVLPAAEDMYTHHNGGLMIRGSDRNEVLKNGFVLPMRGYLEADAANVAGAELYKGASTTVQGGTTTSGQGGMLNLITKKPQEEAFFDVTTSLTVGKYDASEYRTTMDFNHALNDDKTLLFRLNMAADTARPFYMPSDDDYENDTGVFVSPSLTYRPGDRFEINTEFEYQRSRDLLNWGVPYVKGHLLTDYDAFVGSNYNIYKGDWLSGQVTASWKATEDLNVKAGLAYMYLDESQDMFYLTGTLTNANTTQIREGLAKYIYKTFNSYVEASFDKKIGATDHTFSLRADYLRKESQGFFSRNFRSTVMPNVDLDNIGLEYLGSVGIDLPYAATNESVQYRSGVLLQDEIKWDRWRMTLGMRIDHHWTNDDVNDETTFSPSIGVNYMLNPRTSLYGTYSRTCNPNIGVTGADGSLLTKDITTDLFEAGIKRKLTDNLLATAAVFQAYQDNETRGPHRGPFDIDGETYATGVEMSMNGSLNKNWGFVLSYTWQDIEDEDGDIDRYHNTPKHSVSFYPTYCVTGDGFWRGTRVGGGYRYVARRVNHGHPSMAYDGEEYLPSYDVFDVFVEYPVKRFKESYLRLNLENILDEEYYSSARFNSQVQRGEPFSATLTFGMRF